MGLGCTTSKNAPTRKQKTPPPGRPNGSAGGEGGPKTRATVPAGKGKVKKPEGQKRRKPVTSLKKQIQRSKQKKKQGGKI